jgi:hypothetical protein
MVDEFFIPAITWFRRPENTSLNMDQTKLSEKFANISCHPVKEMIITDPFKI